MITMQSPWQSNPRPSEDDDILGTRQDHQLLGQILERSTSAPPLPSEATFDFDHFGDDDDAGGFLFGKAGVRGGTMSSRLGLFDNSGRDTAPLSSTSSAGFFLGYEDKSGRATAPDIFYPSTVAGSMYSSGVGDLGDSSRRSAGNNDRYDSSFDESFREEHLVRSQSAAPALLSRSPLGPPPGLGLRASNESYMHESAADRNNIMQLGQRRSASTGVIGEQNVSSSVLFSLGLESGGSGSGGGTVRPAPKTLMDLIQEDFPKSPAYDQEGHDVAYGAGSTRMETFSQGYGATDQHGYPYRQQEDHGGPTPGSGQNYAYDSHAANDPYSNAPVMQRPHPHRTRVQEHAPQRSVYAPAPQGQTAHISQGHQYEPQPVYYSDRQSSGSRGINPSNGMQTQMLSSGHAVYVNAAPPYGFAAVQYHPTAAQHIPHVVHHPHQPLQNVHPSHEYISVVPIQGGVRGQVGNGSGGTYAYWHQGDVQSVGPGMGPSVAIMNAHGGAPIGMTRVQTAPLDPSPSGGRHGRPKSANTRSPAEKVQKGRRGGAATNRRGGAEAHSKHAPNAAVVSPLLDEFRATKNRDWTMLDIKGHVVEFCQDQNGSRFIQQRLEIGEAREQQIVMAEVLPAVRRLRNDVFGNYVVQKLLEFGTHEMKTELRNSLKGEMLPLSLQMYGCRVVQKALETLDEADITRLLLEFHHNVLSCIHDQNGNHVIQKCIEVMSTKAKNALREGDEASAQFFSEQIDFVIDDVLGNVASLSCHPYGCRVLQRILEHCIDPKKGQVLDEISHCHKPLLDDQYGNYVIQHVLQYGRHSDRESVLHIVVESGLLRLSKQKFASNVVEKLLKYGTPEQRNAVVREMLKVVDESKGTPVDGGNGGSSVVLLMVRDAYANYVVQTTLDVVSEGEEKQLLLEELNAHSTQLRNYTFAKHIVTKLSS